MRFEFARECLVRAVSRSAAPELIDRRIAQRAVKPRDDSFIRRRLLRACDHFCKGILENVFCESTIADATLEVAQKSTVVLE